MYQYQRSAPEATKGAAAPPSPTDQQCDFRAPEQGDDQHASHCRALHRLRVFYIF